MIRPGRGAGSGLASAAGFRGVRTGAFFAGHVGMLALLLALAGGCATAPVQAPTPEATARPSAVQSRTIDGVTVSVAVLTDAQARAQLGVDLGELQLQAVWISVRNGSTRKLWFIRNVLDADIYSAEEVAAMATGLSAAERDRLRQRLRDQSIRSQLLPGMVTEGLVYLPGKEGGRYLDIRLSGDAYDESEARERAAVAGGVQAPGLPRDLRFGFAVPLPDGDFDYERLDPVRIYGDRTLPDLDKPGLRAALEQLPCCTTNADGDRNGDPLNLVLVGDSTDVLNALSRSGWSFTHRITLRSIGRELGAAISGNPYSVAPVSSLHVFGRSQDVALQRARLSISRRNHLRLWMAPFLFEGRQVWVGQVSRDIGIKVTPKSPTLTTHVIDPEIDVAREYLLHSLVASGLVERFGFVRGSVAATPAAPAANLADDPYFSDGMRLVAIIAGDPVPPELVRNLMWERSAAPIAEGQGAAALENVRPIEPD